jgi:hypothetical protein
MPLLKVDAVDYDSVNQICIGSYIYTNEKSFNTMHSWLKIIFIHIMFGGN